MNKHDSRPESNVIHALSFDSGSERQNVPMSATHYNHLDGWRGLAIGLLLIGHFFPVPGINLGAVGVNLFFVLSGWLMTRLLFEQQVPVATFYRRRISRIFPALYVFLVVVALWFGIRGRPIDWSELAAAALFVNNYVPHALMDPTMPFGHMWSLSVEEHSYILLSIVAVAARRGWVRPTLAVAAMTSVFALCGIWYWTQYSGRELAFGKWLRSEVSAYGIFASAFLMLRFRARGIPRVPSFVCPVLLCLGLAFHWWSVPSPVRTIVGVGAFALAINLLPASSPRLRAALGVRPLRQLGIWSFSIYIWQQPFYRFVYEGGMSKGLALVLAIIAGIASFYLIENPMRQHLNRVWGKKARLGSVVVGRSSA